MNQVRRDNGAGQRHPQPQQHPPVDLSTDQAVETTALAGAAAIQKLVAERNDLRARLAAQEQETATYRVLNNDLRRKLLLVHQRYVEMAKGIVGDLERFDATLRESAQEVHNSHEAQMAWDEAPVSRDRRPGAQPNGSA